MAANTGGMRAFFDALAGEWEERDAYEGLRAGVVARAGLKPGLVIADVGCGRGIMAGALLSAQPRRLIEADLSPEMIRLNRAAQTDPRVEFFCGDFLQGEFGMLDAAFFYNAYPHFTDKSALARKLAACISPGGCVVVAHSRGREQINAHHGGGIPKGLTRNLQTPQREFSAFSSAFILADFADDTDFYYMKMTKV